jgi:long-subunit fatty acid transport protein
MRTQRRQSGSVLLIVVVLVTLLAATVMGHLQVNAEEIQLMQNHLHGVEAMTLAEAGFNDALAQLRANPAWTVGFADKTFGTGTYTVTVNDATIRSVATTSNGFSACVEADVEVAPDGPPHLIRIEALRINP